MVRNDEKLTDVDIEYVKRWTERHVVGERFTFLGWKEFHASDPKAPKATKIGTDVVAALEGTPADDRLDFIGLTEGPGKQGEIGSKTGGNAQYYKRIK